MTTKTEFINKWKSWWMLQKQGSELTAAFEKELDAIIDQEAASKNLVNPYIHGNLDNIYLFKVKDYTTTLLGRFENGKYFVQRGDGTKYEYDEYRIVWKQKLKYI